MVNDFIDTEAARFHDAFAADPSRFNEATGQYEPSAILDLKETLECHHQKASKYVDFINDLNQCTWQHVLQEWDRARVAAAKSEQRNRNPLRKTWRSVGAVSSVLGPGLSALPDHLCVLQGGLAVVFSVC